MFICAKNIYLEKILNSVEALHTVKYMQIRFDSRQLKQDMAEPMGINSAFPVDWNVCPLHEVSRVHIDASDALMHESNRSLSFNTNSGYGIHI